MPGPGVIMTAKARTERLWSPTDAGKAVFRILFFDEGGRPVLRAAGGEIPPAASPGYAVAAG